MQHLADETGGWPEHAGLTAPLGPRFPGMQIPEFTVDPVRLQSARIISHDAKDARSRSFDMLRTQVLQAMDAKGWQVLAITSPTAGCGKTLTAINLALSIARQPEREVLLVDVDLQKPQVGSRLGAKCSVGLVTVLQGQVSPVGAVFEACVGDHRMLVLPAETATVASSELMGSSAMHAVLRDLRQEFQSRIIILDLPPMLLGDDVIAILPHVDCVLLVAAVGTSTVQEIEECKRHLRSAFEQCRTCCGQQGAAVEQKVLLRRGGCMRLLLALVVLLIGTSMVGAQPLQPGDTIAISVYQDAKLDRQMVIGPGGMISFPLAGQIRAGGMTPQALEKLLRTKLRPKYTVDLDVTVTVVSTTKPDDELKPRFYVTGEVARPGPYVLREGTSVVQAIAMSGGLGQFAARKRIQVRRKVNGVESTFLFDYAAFESGKDVSGNIDLAPGDVVIVPERGLWE
jgi:protein involved in polysaccharide export with SLBB domain/Mrp family chromosome partitioning ATPase